MDSTVIYYGELSAAQAKMISSESWQWTRLNPSGMSLHLFNPFDPLASTSLETSSVILHLKTKFGMDEVTLKSLTETDGTLFLSPKLIPLDQSQVQIPAEIRLKSRPIIPAKPSFPPMARNQSCPKRTPLICHYHQSHR